MMKRLVLVFVSLAMAGVGMMVLSCGEVPTTPARDNLLDRSNPQTQGIHPFRPANHAAVSTPTVELRWAAEGNHDLGITSRVYLDTQNPPRSTSQIYAGQAVKCYSGALEDFAQYYWRVVSTDGAGNVTVSEVWNFRTIQDGFVLISGGSYTRGSPTSEPQRGSDETQHQVTLSSFWMSPYEVTEALWASVMGGSTTSQLPAVIVNWFDAVAFCNLLSTSRGLTPAYTISGTTVTWNQGANGYRLPTEAEWEYACRAGSTTAFANGPITHTGCQPLDPKLATRGWYCGNSGGNRRLPVGQKLANAWGLYDMHGNMWEWCWDWYGIYPTGSVTNPTGPSSGSGRVFRGGSWYSYAKFCRSAYRGSNDTSVVPGVYGFRLTRSAL